MSIATQEFLNRYGLATLNPQYNAAGADNSSPKLKGGDNFGGAVHRQRRPLTPLQNNNNNAPPPVVGSAAGAGGRQVLELRRELLKGKMTTTTTTKENYPEDQLAAGGQQQLQRAYRVQQEYQHLRYDPNNVVDPTPSQPHLRAGSQEPARGEVKNRILDITAIKSQPKLL